MKTLRRPPWALVCLALSSGCSWTLVQPASAGNTDDLGSFIKAFYPSTYTNGTLGADWCYNVEMSLTDLWWYEDLQYLASKKKYQIYVQHAARIQTIYQDSYDGKNFHWNYSSIFLAVEADDSPIYFPKSRESGNQVYLSSNLGTPQTRKAEANGIASTPLQVRTCENILAPGDTATPTPTPVEYQLARFLEAYFLPYTVTVTVSNLWNAYQTPEHDDKFDFDASGNYIYWNFADRWHAVRNIARIKIELRLPRVKPSDPPSATGHLILGYGGGAGP